MLLTILYVVFAQCNAIYGTIYGKKQVNSYKLLGTSNIDGEQSHTFYAKSLIECGAFCRAKKNCNSFVYNKLSKDCKTYRLWTNTTDNITGNIMDIYAKETKYRDECCAHLELKIVDQTTLYFSKNFDQVNGRSTWIRDDDVSGNDNKKLIWFNDEYGRWVVGHIPTQEEFGLGGRISSGSQPLNYLCPDDVDSNWYNNEPGEEGSLTTVKCYVPGLDCKEHWKEDNFCDELNNNVGCDWDGGDCCGPNITTTACTDGTCYPTCTKCECLDPNYQECGSIEVVESSQFDTEDCSLQFTSSCTNEDYGGKWVLTNDKPCTTYDKNIWFAKKGEPNQYIIFDLGCIRDVKQFEIINYFDGIKLFSSKWGTKDFKIETKIADDYANGNWEFVLKGQMQDNSHLQKECKVPKKSYPLLRNLQMRWVKFTAETYYESGAALQFFRIIFE